MNRKRLILGVVLLATVSMFLICLTLGASRSPIGFGVDISRPAGGTETLFRASITNGISRPIKINARVRVTYTDEGGYELATDYISLAGSGTDIGGLPPQAFDSVLFRADHVGGVRIRFTYIYDADPLRKALSRGLSKLGIRPTFRSATYSWLGRNGLIDGRFVRDYDQTWLMPTNSFH